MITRLIKSLLLGLLLISASSHAKVGGINHLGLAVSDLDASEAFFVKYADFDVLGRDDSYPASFIDNGEIMLTLWRVTDPKKAVQFDRKNNIGLHHVALTVDSFEALDALYQKMKMDKSVNIEFAPELMGRGPTKHMMVNDPSGLRVEFVHRPKR